MHRPLSLVLSAEHGGNQVPRPWRDAFAAPAAALESHRGHDPGSLALARDLERALGAPLVVNRVTRLLVDANRSARNPRRFSEWSRAMPAELLQRAMAEVWAPHREAVEAEVARAIDAGRRVLHVSVHSFTPVLDGAVRAVDVGLLYDPSRRAEVAAADRWLAALGALRPDLRLRRNSPYRGTADGLTKTLRRRFPDARYAGIELEVNQAFPLGPPAAWRALRRDVVRSLAEVGPLGLEPRTKRL